MKKLVLAYSGGLDTSYCLKTLSQEGYEVHAVSVNTGGFSGEEIKVQEEKAYAMGASTYRSIDALQSFYDKIVKYLIFGNVLKNNTYPLSVSAERIVQAIEIIEYAKSIDAQYIAHGSTGAGNDQVRFDLIFQVLAPSIEIMTPIRDNNFPGGEIDYLKSQGIELSGKSVSINLRFMGTSVGGVKPNISSNLQICPFIKAYSKKIILTFSRKLVVSMEKIDAVSIIQQLQELVRICRWWNFMW